MWVDPSLEGTEPWDWRIGGGVKGEVPGTKTRSPQVRQALWTETGTARRRRLLHARGFWSPRLSPTGLTWSSD